MTFSYIVLCISLSTSSEQYESQILVKLCGVHQQDKMSTCKVWTFQNWEKFRLKNCLSCSKPKFAGQTLFLIVGQATFLEFKSETAFQLKIHLRSKSSQALQNWHPGGTILGC